MALDGLRVPLLAAEEEMAEREAEEMEVEEDIQLHYHMKDSKGKTSLDHHLRDRVYRRNTGFDDELIRGGMGIEVLSEERRRKKQYSGSEMIVAVFVVAFDTKKGNIVEWRYPPEVLLEGIEFKSMASGLHNITRDFIYFKQNQLFGLSCYEKIPVASHEERGARMKSVGLLAVGYSDLHLHMDFLQRQVRLQVETPGEYGSLEEYFRHYRNPRIPIGATSDQTSLSLLSNASVHPPSGCFSQLLQLYGPKVFVLWKLALLKKRIIFFSPPPIGLVCHRVYCACLLANHVLPLDIDTDPSPQFYVNVTDIDRLQSLESYVACTTEKIFQSKPHLYDVFVDGESFQYSSESLKYLTRYSLMDETRYAHLSNFRSEDAHAQARNELVLAEYFSEMTSQLLRVMLDAAGSEDHVMTVEMVRGVQLDPEKDRLFLAELANVLNINMTVQHSMDLFSCCL